MTEPAQPDTPYICFWRRTRPELMAKHPEYDSVQISKEVGRLWRGLSDEDRKIWNGLAVEDQERYKRQMFEYLSPLANVNPIGASTIASSSTAYDPKVPEVKPREKKRKLPLSTIPNAFNTSPAPTIADLSDKNLIDLVRLPARKQKQKPRKPRTAFNLFYMAQRHWLRQVHHLSHNECSALCGRLWRSMSDLEKKRYANLVYEDKLRYTREVGDYNATFNKVKSDDMKMMVFHKTNSCGNVYPSKYCDDEVILESKLQQLKLRFNFMKWVVIGVYNL